MGSDRELGNQLHDPKPGEPQGRLQGAINLRAVVQRKPSRWRETTWMERDFEAGRLEADGGSGHREWMHGGHVGGGAAGRLQAGDCLWHANPKRGGWFTSQGDRRALKGSPKPGGSTCALPQGTLAGDFGCWKAEDPACASASKSRQGREANDLPGTRRGGRRKNGANRIFVTTTSGFDNPMRAAPRERES